jgi:hypothetical protein
MTLPHRLLLPQNQAAGMALMQCRASMTKRIYTSAISRLGTLPEVFTGSNVTVLMGWKSGICSSYLAQWRKAGLIKSLGGRSDVHMNLVRNRQVPRAGPAPRVSSGFQSGRRHFVRGGLDNANPQRHRRGRTHRKLALRSAWLYPEHAHRQVVSTCSPRHRQSAARHRPPATRLGTGRHAGPRARRACA